MFFLIKTDVGKNFTFYADWESKIEGLVSLRRNTGGLSTPSSIHFINHTLTVI